MKKLSYLQPLSNCLQAPGSVMVLTQILGAGCPQHPLPPRHPSLDFCYETWKHIKSSLMFAWTNILGPTWFTASSQRPYGSPARGSESRGPLHSLCTCFSLFWEQHLFPSHQPGLLFCCSNGTFWTRLPPTLNPHLNNTPIHLLPLFLGVLITVDTIFYICICLLPVSFH